MSLFDERVALVEQIKANTATELNVVPYVTVEDSSDPPYPRLTLEVQEIEYHATAGGDGYAEVRGQLRLEIRANNMETAARMMSAFLDPQGIDSIQQAVARDQRLGGAVQACRVLTAAILSPLEATLDVAWMTKKSGAQA